MATRTIDTVGIDSFVTVRDTDEQFAVVHDEHNVVVSEGIIGPPGAPGAKGDQGIQGIPGVSGASYVHDQAVASETWTIDHNLGRFPALVAVDSAGDEIEGMKRYESLNRIVFTVSAPCSGKAYIN